MEHKFNYVIFNAGDEGLPAINDEGYYSICLRDLWNKDFININNAGFSQYKGFLKKIMRKFFTLAQYRFQFFLPFFFNKYFIPKFSTNNPICFVCFRYVELSYLQYLKKKYPNAKFIKYVRDIISTQQTYYDKYQKAKIFDYWVTYDEDEARHYGMEYFNEIESKIELPKEANEIKYDVFMAARAKKRLPQIIKVYDKLVSQGIKPFFYITNVKQEEQIHRDGIIYANKLLTYRQMLIYSCQAKFLLEINQVGAVGYTSRYIEAILYNKRLLTNNMALVNAPYYNPKNIQCFKNIEDIDASILISDEPVNYNYKGDFSPMHLIDYFETLLSK